MKGLAYLTRAQLHDIACQSSVCPDPVRFPALSQIKPHAPRVLVVPFRQFLQQAKYPIGIRCGSHDMVLTSHQNWAQSSENQVSQTNLIKKN